jgi:5-methyltetrahydropteroyltriglutamate--homocysteine methyltransferase
VPSIREDCKDCYARRRHHSTDLVEHPELVADRIITFAELVGREKVIASANCSLGCRVRPEIAWAKLRALRDGAAIASKKWR